MNNHPSNSNARFKAVVTLIAVLCATWAVSGCGSTSNPPTTKADRQLETRPLDLLLPDCSPSFRAALPGFRDATQRIVLDSASRSRTLWMACFDGSPLRSVDFDPKVDFADLTDSVSGSETLAARFTEARALGTLKNIEKAIAATENQVKGSGQLEALEMAAKTPDTGRVFLVTDLLSHEADGLNLATVSKVDIQQTVKRWLPRLRGLRGVQVFVIGAGLGAGSSEAVRNAEQLFTTLITQAGGKVSITQEIPATLLLAGSGS